MRSSGLEDDFTWKRFRYATSGERSRPPCAELPWHTCSVQPCFSSTTFWIPCHVLSNDSADVHSLPEPPPPPPPPPLAVAPPPPPHDATAADRRARAPRRTRRALAFMSGFSFRRARWSRLAAHALQRRLRTTGKFTLRLPEGKEGSAIVNGARGPSAPSRRRGLRRSVLRARR